MQEVISYNFNADDIKNDNYESLFEKIRRDSCFAFVGKSGGKYIALRDHLGVAPLYYRFYENDVKFSFNFIDLVKNQDEFDKEGIKYFLFFGTIKLFSIIKDIKVVPAGSVVEIYPEERKIKCLYEYKVKILPKLKNKYSEIINDVDDLLLKATKRIHNKEEVGLYLSGGIDSALTGIFLKKAGIKINAYTCATEGLNSQEVELAKKNAETIGVDNHEIIPWNSSEYEKYLKDIPEIFGTVSGARSSLGLASLWEKSNIKNEKQIYFSQNTYTLACSVAAQYYTYFVSFLPKFIKKYISLCFKYDNIFNDYLSFASNGSIKEYKKFEDIYPKNSSNKIVLLTLAGMYIVHSPCDGEVLMAPALRKNIQASNIYYDMDLIEYYLRIPLKFRLEFSRESKFYFALGKRIFRSVAKRYLDKKVINKKRGFLVPANKDLYDLDTFMDIKLPGRKAKYGAKVLLSLCEYSEIIKPKVCKK
jgi:hypothetical protein